MRAVYTYTIPDFIWKLGFKPNPKTKRVEIFFGPGLGLPGLPRERSKVRKVRIDSSNEIGVG